MAIVACRLNLRTSQAFACEKDDKKAVWLQAQLDDGDATPCVFMDNAHMSGVRAECRVHKRSCLIKHCRCVGAGFTCKARSSLNARASQTRGCVQRGSESTGESWGTVEAFLDSHHPDAFFAENLAALCQEVPGSEETDAEYVTRSLRERGYGTVEMAKIEASQYGSKALRCRLYWVALLGDDGGRGETVREIIRAVQLEDEEPWNSYLLSDALLTLHTTSPRGTSSDADHKADHMGLFDEAKLPWPAPRSLLPHCHHLEQRPFEALVYVNAAWPYELDEDGGCPPEFVDVNFSLARLAPDGLQSRSPWRRDQLGTMTGSGQYIVRTAKNFRKGPVAVGDGDGGDVMSCLGGPSSDVTMRQLEGAELMQLAGYDAALFTSNWPDHSLGVSLAGNAFSAFAVLPVLIAILATVFPDATAARPRMPARADDGLSGSSDAER